MVRICHLTTVHKRYDVRIVHKECLSLVKAGYDVHLIVADGSNDEIFKSIHIHDIGKQSNRFRRMLISPLQVLLKSLSLKARIYHFHDAELLVVGILLRFMGYQVIYDVHDNLPKQMLDKHYLPAFLRLILSHAIRLFENAVVPIFTTIITADINKENRFKSLCNKVVTLHNYPLLRELPQFNYALRKPDCICYIGGITKIRGILNVIGAIEDLPVKLILAGEFDPPSLLLESKAKRGWSKVDYRGFLSRAEIAEVLSESSIGLVTLLPNQNYLESLPIKMFEYMSASIPVILSDFQFWREIIDKHHCGIYVNPNDIQEIVKAIEYLLKNPDIGKTMGEHGRQAIENYYNWENQASILEVLYGEIAQK